MEYVSNEDHLRNPLSTTEVNVFRQKRTKWGPFKRTPLTMLSYNYLYFFFSSKSHHIGSAKTTTLSPLPSN